LRVHGQHRVSELATGTDAGTKLVDMSIVTAMMMAFRLVGRTINDKGMR
jgi:hypothetical protein